MWKIALSALLTIFALVWFSVIATRIKRLFDDDDQWPGGNWVTP